MLHLLFIKYTVIYKKVANRSTVGVDCRVVPTYTFLLISIFYDIIAIKVVYFTISNTVG